MEAFRRWTTRLLERIAIAGVAILGVAIVLVVADIALRAIFNHSITGTVDITQLCVMAAVFWTIPYAFIRDGHVGITLATDWLPRRGVAVLDMLAALAGLAFVVLMTRYGWEQAMRSLDYGDRSQTIGIPMIWYWGFLLSGGVLSCLATLVIAAHHLLVAMGWQPPAPAERN
ncbi:TRAP transporter small permease [Ectothiorhodospiraceae bacterium WFHF3C12]|nr:TRAP transporter small permease [Ectothiorhodospiraceae bacterium WFHF3C12]